MSELNLSPPYSKEGEEAVLGSFLIDPDSLFYVVGFLKPKMFYVTANRWIYESILRIYNQNNPVDILTVLEDLRFNKQLENVGGEPYLAGLVGAVPNSMNCESYARIIEAKWKRRQMIQGSAKMAKLAYDETVTIDEVLDRAGMFMSQLTVDARSDGAAHISDVGNRFFDRLEAVYANQGVTVGIPTGLSDYDKLTGGLQPGEVTIVAARPGMGKTACANGWGLNAAKLGKSVAIFNLEMGDTSVYERLMATETKISLQRLRSGQIEDQEWPLIHRARQMFNNLRIHMMDIPGISPTYLRSECRRIMAEHGLDLILVDYLQLMSSTGNYKGNRVQEISEVSRELKNLARELNIPIVAAAQLSRGVESRPDKRPKLSDIKESGSVEQDADLVVFIYRDDYYNKDDSDRPNIAEIIVAKHRNGPTKTVDTYWNPTFATFANLKHKEIDLNSSSFDEPEPPADPWPHAHVRVRKKKRPSGRNGHYTNGVTAHD